jgi:putative tryptophan/tyrosine transport system substrate-binding protein
VGKLRLEQQMKRRDFVALLGGAAATWPLAARAQNSDRIRRIAALIPLTVDDPISKARISAFMQGLQQLGWIDGRNIRIEIRWAAAYPFGARSPDTRSAYAERFRRYAAELIGLAPDVILAHSSPAVAALQQETRTLPIVFVGVVDPVGAGFVTNLARPGGNTTGFIALDFGLSAKWLELLKELVPKVTRVAVLRDPSFAAGIGQLAAMQAVAPSLGMELTPIDERDTGEIERGLDEFARAANGALIVTASVSQGLYRKLIVTLAARHRLPAVYPFRYMVADGGLISYGTDLVDQYRRAADYVDRILKGQKPDDLPVQAPVKYELVVNLRTARALGLELPLSVLGRADEVIE